MCEVWIINHYAVTPDLPGGTRHYDLGTELVRRGFRVKVFASDVSLLQRQHTKLRPGQPYAVETWDGVDFVWVRSTEYRSNNWRRAWNMLSFARNLMPVMKAVGGRSLPDVIIGSSPHPLAALAAQRGAQRFGAHFWLEVRDLWPQVLVDLGGFSRFHPGIWAMRKLERYLYARAEKIMVLARGALNHLERQGVDAKRLLYLPNGVHLGHFQFSVSRDEARQRYGFEAFTIVYAGAHSLANDLETVLRAGELLQSEPVEFVLVGDGPTKHDLIGQARQLGLHNVRFLPPVNKRNIPDLLHAADATLITLKNAPTFAYGISPNKLFDYMAVAHPVICNVPGHISELVEAAQAGVVCPPENAGALAAAVRRLLAMTEPDREFLGDNGFNYVHRHYRREVLADHLADALLAAGSVDPGASGPAVGQP